MILVAHETGSRELQPIINRIGYAASIANLRYGDFAFEGNGPAGPINIGVERKSLHDMLHCIDDAHYAGRQRGGMRSLYQLSFLAIEGMFRPHDNEGYLMEGFRGGAAWGPCKYRQRAPLYSKLFNYLVSVAMSGVIITFSRDMYGTAYNVCMLYDYFQKPWDSHTSMSEVQLLPLAEVGGRPSLVLRWATQIDDIGVKLGKRAEELFPSAYDLGQSTAEDWVKIKGISARTAQRIEREIREGRR